jgi:YidC/Oxa1 family membrane protein insertase
MSFANPSDLLRAALFVLAHWCGGSFGAAIIIASVALRVAMLPITLGATRRHLVRERRMRALEPQVAALKRRYAAQPAKIMSETQKLYAANGVELFDQRMLMDGLLQFPPAALLYSAIGKSAGLGSGGFLWMANLITPDRALAAAAGAITATTAWLAMPSGESRQVSQLVPLAITGAVTFLILSHLSAGVALYSITNAVVGGVEQAIARRTLPALPVGRA